MAPVNSKAGHLRTRPVQWHDHDGQVVIVESRSKTIALNPTAALLWRRLVEGADRQGLINALIAEFDIDMLTALRDVDAFVDGLARRGLLAEAV